mgnify:CR=1 FL=1
MFEETGLRIPASTEFLVGVSAWTWWALSALSVGALLAKDRWIEGRRRCVLNWLYAGLVLVTGAAIVCSLLLPCCGLSDRL